MSLQLECEGKAITHIGFPSSDPLSVPGLMLETVTTSALQYRVQRNDDTINPLIAGYEVIRFGVPMIGEYVNAGRRKTVTISPSVPGAQYRITAWALHRNGSRSATPAVVYATTGEASEHGRHKIHCTLNVSLFKIETCKPNAASTRAPHLDTYTPSTCTMVVFFLPSTNTNTIKGL